MKGSHVFLGVLLAVLCTAALPAHADEYSYKRTVDRTAPLAGAAAIGVAGYNGNIHLYPDGGRSVRIHAVLGARSADTLKMLDVQASREGSTLRIADVCPSTRRLVFWEFKDCDIQLDVHYPRGMPVSVHSENGNIVIDGSGAVSVENGNGNIHVNGPGGAVSIKNSNGNVTVADAAANVSVSNRNGNVKATVARSWHGSAIAMSTNAGNVELAVPRSFTAKLTARTRLGDVKDTAHLGTGPATVTATTTFGNVVVSRT